MAYGTKYTVPFYSMLGKSCEFRIQKKDYSGSSTELIGAVPPCVRYVKGENDEIEDRILRSECNVRVNSLTNYALLELFTSDAKEYRGQLYVDSSLYWQGFLTPDYYQEPYIPAPYEVELKFTDGLGILKNIDYDYADYIYGLGVKEMRLRLWDQIRYAIGKSSNLLPYSEGVNIYEENQDQTDADSMPYQTFCNARVFDGMNCYDVLNELLKACGNARMWQQGGRWYIVSLNAMKADYTVRRYAATGTYEDYTTISPRVEITDNSGSPLNVFLDEPVLDMIPAWKKFILNQNYGFRDNILDIYDYTEAGLIVADTDGIYEERSYLLHIGTTPTAYNWNFGMYIQYNLATVDGVTDAAYYLEVVFDPAFVYEDPALPYGAVYSVFITGSGTTYWLYSDGSWSTSQPSINELAAAVNTPSNITTEVLPINGTVYMRIYNTIHPTATTDLYFFNENQLSVSLIKSSDTAESKTITTDINSEQNFVPDEYDMTLGDLPDIDNNEIMYLGGLYYYSDGEYIPTQYWKVKGQSDLKHLINLMADEIAVNHIRPMAMISGSLKCNFEPGSVVQTAIDNDRLFVLKRFSENLYGDEWDCDLVEFAHADQGYLKLRSGGYVKLRGGGKIKLRQ